MTTTIEDQFGSRLMTAGGFLLNNELTDFSFVPEVDGGKPVANRVEAGKRPRSSMAPTIVLRRAGPRGTWSPDRRAAARSSTTSRRRSSAIIDWDLDPQAAIGAAELRQPQRADGARGGTEVARSSEPKLRALGAEVRGRAGCTSGVQAIVRTRDGWIGGADPRREGVVRGR